jgi:8-oxo-dGTP pyrophosphatase MutT (NUDIX family)
VWAFVAHPRARGVKCVLRDASGRAIFVRHHYGNRRRWELPGGGAHHGETLADAARREAREELGADVAEWRELGSATVLYRGREEAIAVFAAEWPGGPVRPDPVEIAVVDWFALERPPDPLGPTTEAALAVAYPRR